MFRFLLNLLQTYNLKVGHICLILTLPIWPGLRGCGCGPAEARLPAAGVSREH